MKDLSDIELIDTSADLLTSNTPTFATTASSLRTLNCRSTVLYTSAGVSDKAMDHATQGKSHASDEALAPVSHMSICPVKEIKCKNKRCLVIHSELVQCPVISHRFQMSYYKIDMSDNTKDSVTNFDSNPV